MGLELTELRDDDADTLFAWVNEPDLVEHSAVFRAVSRSEHDTWFRRVRTDPAVAAYAVRENATLIGLGQLLMDGDEAELRIRIGTAQARDRGLGTEVVAELVRIGFQELGLRRIWLQVFKRNERAIRVYEKTGFRPAGEAGELLFMDQGAGSSVPSSRSV
jgi:RimJ/RimL family protein N-acetyltransferase